MKKKYIVVISLTTILILIVAIFIIKEILMNKNKIENIDLSSLQISKYGELNEDLDVQMVIVSQQPLEIDVPFEYEIINNTNEKIDYGEMYILEVYDNGNWYTINRKGKNNTWTAMGTILLPNSTNKEIIDLSIYEIYPSRLYRIVKEFYNGSIASVEFDIK